MGGDIHISVGDFPKERAIFHFVQAGDLSTVKFLNVKVKFVVARVEFQIFWAMLRTPGRFHKK